MNKVYFKNVVEIGNLYLDYVFYEFESEPILFTCVDSKGEIYFCHCSDIRHEQIWFITRCDIDTLNALVNKYIDIASIFLKSERIIKIIMDLQGKERSQVICPNQIDSLDLPKPETYLMCNKEKAVEYLYGKRCTQLKNKNILTAKNKQPLISFSIGHEFDINLYIQAKSYINYLNDEIGYIKAILRYAEYMKNGFFTQTKGKDIDIISKNIQRNGIKPKSKLETNDNDLWAA